MDCSGRPGTKVFEKVGLTEARCDGEQGRSLRPTENWSIVAVLDGGVKIGSVERESDVRPESRIEIQRKGKAKGPLVKKRESGKAGATRDGMAGWTNLRG